MAGVELVRKADGGQAYALVSPLLTTASGQKMGKTEGNSVWLDASLTSPYDFYQYWVNVDDADVEKLLRLYTFLPDARIAELTAAGGAACAKPNRCWRRKSRASPTARTPWRTQRPPRAHSSPASRTPTTRTFPSAWWLVR
ncbi:MAG: hypothetical protein R2853_00925 [Thermomicrobiales bacterium]